MRKISRLTVTAFGFALLMMAAVFGTGWAASGSSTTQVEAQAVSSPTYVCAICGAYHGGVYSTSVCYNCYGKR